MPETISHQYHIAANHPCFSGHFPNDPVVPGVILLDYTRRLLNQWKPGFSIIAIPQAKFHQRLRPEQNFRIRLTAKTSSSIKFECFTEACSLASGTLTIKPQS